MTGPCRVHETVTIGLHVDNGTWQVDAEPLGHAIRACDHHQWWCPALRDAPPLPTLTQLADLIGGLLREQGYAATQAVLGGETP